MLMTVFFLGLHVIDDIGMERILLVEPNYKNKYPPIGLMKISTYFNAKGDYVLFHKGLLSVNEAKSFDKVFITTLFTFDFDLCIDTIRYYSSIVGLKNVFVGGIAASIMPERFLEEIPSLRLSTGQLTSSYMLGYDDDVNIDILELDYDLLWDIDYEYPASDSYFIYTSRGCPRACAFCAVHKLEPEFYTCDNIEDQIKRVDEKFGVKKNLLIMDNNILYSDAFCDSVDTLVRLGFGKDNNTIQKNSKMKYYISSLKKRYEAGRPTKALLKRMRAELLEIKKTRISNDDKERLNKILGDNYSGISDDVVAVNTFIDNAAYLSDFFDRYHYHKISRYVDFNQGLDARLFTHTRALKMSELAVRPCRIAFDNLNIKTTYLQAMENAVECGITHFSNYLLYNFKEKPESLWKRLKINIDFCEKHKNDNITLFSFPMKYADINQTDRSYVGAFWHKKQLRALNVILNVTKGVVAKERDFFEKAYGKSPEEFIEILAMPDEFIRYRNYFTSNGYIDAWRQQYRLLGEEDKKTLMTILDDIVDNPEVFESKRSLKFSRVLKFYAIKKKNVDKARLLYDNLVFGDEKCLG